MHKLTTMTRSPILDELLHRLAEASIDATVSDEKAVGELYLGSGVPTAGVWLAEKEDIPVARGILEAVMADTQRRQTVNTCPECDYDLRGHAGRTSCPECGTALQVTGVDVACAKCGELVPPAFEVCWNCGADVKAP